MIVTLINKLRRKKQLNEEGAIMNKKHEDEKLQKESLFLEMSKKKKEQELLEKKESEKINQEQVKYKSPTPFRDFLKPKPEPK